MYNPSHTPDATHEDARLTTQHKPIEDFDTVDLSWAPEPLWDEWPKGRDTSFIMWRMEEAFLEKSLAGTGGRLLDVACGYARHAPEMHRHGWQVYGLEPSPEMVRRARDISRDEGTPLVMMRGIGETLPFKDATFDRILCMSSLDHFANPQAGMQEMARILKPDGDLIIGIVNYGGLPRRVTRAIYSARRRLHLVPKGKRLFWDDPTEGEHTFEGSIASVTKHAAPALKLTEAYGVSMLWAFPGWSSVFKLMPGRSKPAVVARDAILKGLDRLARRIPDHSDFLVLTFRRT